MAEKLELRLDESPALRAPVLLAAFAGWGDGAVAGTGALQYIVGKHEARQLGEFESDAVYQYTSTRPVTRAREDGRRELIWPSLALHACPLPDSDRDVLILYGPEPDLRWRALADAIVDVAGRCGVSDVVVLGSYWDRVSHLGQALLTGRTADAATRERLAALGLAESTYQGPTGFPSALLDACQRRGLVGVGLSARAPHYVQGITHPKLAHGLLQATERLYGLRLDVDALDQAAHEQERLLTERVQQEPKLWRYVQQLAAEAGQLSTLDDFASSTWQTLKADGAESAGPPSSAPSPVSGARTELPSGKDMVDAVEQFLRGDGQS
jgi:predicted ATP-grasp superfamily ATP-dependent carboligase